MRGYLDAVRGASIGADLQKTALRVFLLFAHLVNAYEVKTELEESASSRHLTLLHSLLLLAWRQTSKTVSVWCRCEWESVPRTAVLRSHELRLSKVLVWQLSLMAVSSWRWMYHEWRLSQIALANSAGTRRCRRWNPATTQGDPQTLQQRLRRIKTVRLDRIWLSRHWNMHYR